MSADKTDDWMNLALRALEMIDWYLEQRFASSADRFTLRCKANNLRLLSKQLTVGTIEARKENWGALIRQWREAEPDRSRIRIAMESQFFADESIEGPQHHTRSYRRP
jgi:hypothetical protein